MSLIDAPSLPKSSKPIRTEELPSGAYVLSLAALSSVYAASSSAPVNAIHLFDRNSFKAVGQLPGHGDAITAMRSIRAFAGTAKATLLTCGRDATVKLWDERTGSAGVQMYALAGGKSRALLCCDMSPDGNLAAAGTDLQGDDAFLLYWDVRSPAAPLRTQSETHSDDITAVHFLQSGHSAPGHRVLLSVSSDGLLSTTNADEPDEDEATMYVGNWGCSISQAGWVHGRAGSPGIWASSDMETFSAWTSELDLVQDVDIRQPSIHRQDLTWVTDYVIGCHNNAIIPEGRDNDLSIFLGSNEGDIALITRPTYSDKNAPWNMERLWTGNHAGVVRSALWDEENNVLLTGGEDSKINVWAAPSASSPQKSVSPKRETDAMDVDDDLGESKKRKRT